MLLFRPSLFPFFLAPPSPPLPPYMAAPSPRRPPPAVTVASGPQKGQPWVDAAVVGVLLVGALWVLYFL